jgi:hypothetical protein
VVEVEKKAYAYVDLRQTIDDRAIEQHDAHLSRRCCSLCCGGVEGRGSTGAGLCGTVWPDWKWGRNATLRETRSTVNRALALARVLEREREKRASGTACVRCVGHALPFCAS